MDDIERPILEHISGVIGEGTPLSPDTPLLETGMLDSINLVRLVQFLEERFRISISDADLGPELFETPAALAAYVRRHTA